MYERNIMYHKQRQQQPCKGDMLHEQQIPLLCRVKCCFLSISFAILKFSDMCRDATNVACVTKDDYTQPGPNV